MGAHPLWDTIGPHGTHWATLISISLARHRFTLPDHGYGASASSGVPAYIPAFSSTHCGHPWKDGQYSNCWRVGEL